MSMSNEGVLQEAPNFELHEAILATRPVVPVDRPDISHLEALVGSYAPGHPGYSREGWPRWMGELEELFGKINVDMIVCWDMCSSVAQLAQMLRGGHLSRSYERAKDLTGMLYATNSPKNNALAPASFDEELRPLKASAGKNQTARLLLRTAVQHVLYTMNKDDITGGSKEVSEKITERLSGQLGSERTVYERQLGDDSEANWQIKWGSAVVSATFPEILASLTIPTAEAIEAGQRMKLSGKNPEDIEIAKQRQLAGMEMADRLLVAHASDIGSFVADNPRQFRPARYVSLDYDDPMHIALSSLINTPPQSRESNLYAHALTSMFDPLQHHRGSIFDPIPAPDHSLTLITNYDGWPVYDTFEDKSDLEIDHCIEIGALTLYNFYQKLALGGKYIGFPWITADTDRDRSARILEDVVGRTEQIIGHGIAVEPYDISIIEEMMSPSDQITREHSAAIFAGRRRIPALKMTKPPSMSLVEAHAKKRAWREANFPYDSQINVARAEGWPDPRQ